MNTVERLWRAIARRDDDAIRAQLHPNATIAFPHSGEVLSAHDYAILCGSRSPAFSVEVRAVVSASEDLPVAVHASAMTPEGPFRCGAFYILQQARIAHGTELWVAEIRPAESPDPPAAHHRH
jgi:hypothetical protein